MYAWCATLSCYYNHYPIQQIPLDFPLQLNWRRGPDMPYRMGGYVQSVVVEGTVYVGGGGAGFLSDNGHIVMTYDISTEKWATLPPYKEWGFAMTAISCIVTTHEVTLITNSSSLHVIPWYWCWKSSISLFTISVHDFNR